MIKVALVKADGEIQTIVSPSTDTQYIDGQTYGEATARIIPLDTNTREALNLWYWFEGGWLVREPRPDNLSRWENYSWVTDVTELWDEIRDARGVLLINCDWTQLNDAPLTTAEVTAWCVYRQALRDIPITYPASTQYSDIIWPIAPS